MLSRGRGRREHHPVAARRRLGAGHRCCGMHRPPLRWGRHRVNLGRTAVPGWHRRPGPDLPGWPPGHPGIHPPLLLLGTTTPPYPVLDSHHGGRRLNHCVASRFWSWIRSMVNPQHCPRSTGAGRWRPPTPYRPAPGLGSYRPMRPHPTHRAHRPLPTPVEVGARPHHPHPTCQSQPPPDQSQPQREQMPPRWGQPWWGWWDRDRYGPPGRRRNRHPRSSG
jgi:hypothetical protein